jgi:hypothetical protein
MNQFEIDSFEKHLEVALAQPENFDDLIGPKLEPLNERKLNAMLRVLKSQDVIANQLIANLFVEKTGKEGAVFLESNLDENNPALFSEISAILAKMQHFPATKKLILALNGRNDELVIPVLKALSKFEGIKEIDDSLVDFYLNYSNESKLFASIRYMLPRQENLVHLFLEKYRRLNPNKKMWVLKFLAETGNNEALHLFDEELQAEPLEKGLYCISGLGRIRNDEAVKILVKQLKTSEWFLRKKVVEALGQTGREIAVEPLLQMLDDKSVQVRAAAVESLSKLGNLKPQLLINKLQNSQGEVKSNLIRAMGQLKNKMFLEPLIEALKDRKALFFTIDALGDLGLAEAEPALKRLMKDKDWFNRLNALEALAKLSLENINQIAQQALDDENDMVRNSAARIIGSQKTRNGNGKNYESQIQTAK